MKHPILATLAVLGAVTAAQAADITPTRIGPVSQYGQLMAGKNSQNKGQIYGSCEGIKDGAEVQVRGMSLYWSLMDEALEFWSEEGVTSMVNDMKIQIVRAAMATGKEDWTKGKYIGYEVQPEVQTNFMKAVVEAAIKQDIYVIIDWHSHEANTQTQNAVKFFGEMAQEYGKYDNVIFEVFNEPKKVEWNVIKTYADAVVAEIRKYSDNLILVGTPEWDQFPNRAIGSEVSDPQNNTAYTFHYYAGTHCITGMHPGNQFWACEGDHAIEAMNAGLSVFVSEWGVTTSDGKGSVAGDNNGWQSWMNENKLSWANWSGSKIPEGSAAFSEAATKTSLQYSASGTLVKSYLASNADSYTRCPTNVPESSSSQTPTSQANLSSQADVVKSSSSAQAIAAGTAREAFRATFINGMLALESTASGLTQVSVFDLLGNLHVQKEIHLSEGSHSIHLNTLPAGSYLVRIRQGQNTLQKRIQVR